MDQQADQPHHQKAEPEAGLDGQGGSTRQDPSPPSPTNPPSTPLAPPTSPTGPIQGHPPNAGLAVLGVLMCIFGSIGLIQRVLGLGAMLFMPNVYGMVGQQPLPSGLRLAALVLGVLTLSVSVAHIMAGVQTLRRRPNASAWVTAFFALVVLFTPPGIILQILNFRHMQSQPGTTGAPPSLMIASMAIGVLISLAWPTFLLIWFKRKQTRQVIQSWAERPALA